jgi:prepilin-type N-terminal cleavage/methylation domain-containing protein
MRFRKGITLLELAVALAVFSIILAISIGYQVEESRRELARRYVGSFVAIDQALFTMYMQIISYRNTFTVPVCSNGGLGTLVNAKNGWATQSPYSGVVSRDAVPLSYLDPRVDYTKFKLVVSGGRIVGVQLIDSAVADSLNDWFVRLLPSRWDSQAKMYKNLNNGQGYPANLANWLGCS